MMEAVRITLCVILAALMGLTALITLLADDLPSDTKKSIQLNRKPE